MTCPAASRSAWRETTVAAAAMIRQHRSDPVLKQILQEGLSSFHSEIQSINEALYPPQYHRLVQEQNAIGWDQVYRGRWSHQWSHMHCVYAHAQEGWTGQEKDGICWVVCHGKKLMEQWLLLWSIRNKEKHGMMKPLVTEHDTAWS